MVTGHGDVPSNRNYGTNARRESGRAVVRTRSIQDIHNAAAHAPGTYGRRVHCGGHVDTQVTTLDVRPNPRSLRPPRPSRPYSPTAGLKFSA
jgi:hypothetical protein